MTDAFKTFPNLLRPLNIRGVQYRNRMFSAPLGSAEVIADGQPSMDTVMYLERKAAGGAAMINWGEVDVDPEEFQEGRWPREITRSSNYNYARLASAVKMKGAVPCIELCFSGAHARFYGVGANGKTTAWGPVDTRMMMGYEVKAMTEEKILEVVNGFASAAFAAKNAGFEMICLHGAHGFGLQQFMSPTMNTRTDDWGGSPEKRCRFAVETMKAIRRMCGEDFPIEIRISGSEIDKDGYGIDEGVRIAEQLDGYADIIHVSVGAINRFGAETQARTHLSMFYPFGRNVEYAAEIKKHVNKSLVGAVGGLSDPYYMEEILASNQADIIYIARGLVCDPDLPKKVRQGRPETIRKCMRCLNCFGEGVAHGDLVCAINPEISREREVYRALPQPEKKKVLVIGGGIAGMQAALSASKLGHDVILCEKSGELGGRILCERDVPFKQRLHEYIELMRREIEKSNIDLRLDTEVTREYAEKEDPGAIIAALGSDPIIPNIPGIEGQNVYHAIEVYENPKLAKGKAVILGAGFVGTELAILLKGDYGVDCEVIEAQGSLSTGGNSVHSTAVMDMIGQKQIPLRFFTKVSEITPEGVKCETREGELFIPAETIIIAVGMKPKQAEAIEFSDISEEYYMAGDCRKAANILYATSTAYNAAKYIGI